MQQDPGSFVDAQQSPVSSAITTGIHSLSPSLPVTDDARPGRPRPSLLPPASAYLDDIVHEFGGPDGLLVSVILFGSAATGGYARTGSDIDLLVVLRDGTDAAARERVRDRIGELEAQHGMAKTRPRQPGALAGALASFFDRLTANVRSFFVCTRADLLSGEARLILDIPGIQARFVDRATIPSIVRSGVTIAGEDLLTRVPLPPLRRVDVAVAFFGLWNQLVFIVLAYPLLPGATRYAMDTLKRSVHNCYLSHAGWPAPLAAEVDFFEARYGPAPTLRELLALRDSYRPSFSFVLRCLPTLASLHLRTARHVSFPRQLEMRAVMPCPVSEAIPLNEEAS